MREPKQIMQAPRYFIQVPTYSITGLNLNSTDKLVYGQILTMLNVTGACFMSNARMAEPIEVKPRSVSRSISKLRDAGLINVKLTYKGDTKEIDKRFITINPTTNLTTPPVDKNGDTPTTKKTPPHDKYVVVNRLFNRLLNIYKERTKFLEESKNKYFITNKTVRYDSYTAFSIIDSKFGTEFARAVISKAQKLKIDSDKMPDFVMYVSDKAIRAKTTNKAINILRDIKYYYSSDSNYMKLSNLLLSRIRRNDINFKEPNLQRWSDDMRKLVEIDKRTCKQVQDVIIWCQNDEFWRSNILSAAKLRKQYSKLLIQSKSSKGNINEQLPDWARDEYKHEKENTAVDPKKAAEMKERIKKIKQARRDA